MTSQSKGVSDEQAALAGELEALVPVKGYDGSVVTFWLEPRLRVAILAALRAPTLNDRDAVIEECAKLCEQERDGFLSEQYAVGQPLASFGERFACDQCAAAIRALNPDAPNPEGSE